MLRFQIHSRIIYSCDNPEWNQELRLGLQVRANDGVLLLLNILVKLTYIITNIMLNVKHSVMHENLVTGVCNVSRGKRCYYNELTES